jgi:hypothetical protein
MAVVTNFSDLDLSKTYTYSDYLLWQFQERVELINGFILKMNPAPNNSKHDIHTKFNLYLEAVSKNIGWY